MGILGKKTYFSTDAAQKDKLKMIVALILGQNNSPFWCQSSILHFDMTIVAIRCKNKKKELLE